MKNKKILIVILIISILAIIVPIKNGYLDKDITVDLSKPNINIPTLR